MININMRKWIWVLMGFSVFWPGVTALAVDSITIHLQIESTNSTLYDGEITVTPCAIDDDHSASISGYCAIEQSGLTTAWSQFGADKFLDSIEGIGNDFVNNLYWGWFDDLEYGATSLNAHTLTEGEHLLVNIGLDPIRVSTSNRNPNIDDVVTITVEHFGFDAFFNGIWIAAPTAILNIDGQSVVLNGNGRHEYRIESTDPIQISASLAGYIDGKLTLNSDGRQQILAGSAPIFLHYKVNIPQAIQYLLSQQRVDGSFGHDLYTDWVNIALASAGINKDLQTRKTYISQSTDNLTSATDYERRAMALMALGVNPYNGTHINYIEKIVGFYDGAQIGDVNLVNDDIFALFPLIGAGYTAGDEIVSNVTNFILKNQKENGSWTGGVDITAAAVQALSNVRTLPSVNNAISRARDYLASAQQYDGGFGSSFATSWTLQAIVALGEDQDKWQIGVGNPEDSLAGLQDIKDGGMERADKPETTRIWSTSYVVPAVLHKPWMSIIGNFAKQDLPVLTIESETSVDQNSRDDIEVVDTASSTLDQEGVTVLETIVGRPTVDTLSPNQPLADTVTESLTSDDKKPVEPQIEASAVEIEASVTALPVGADKLPRFTMPVAAHPVRTYGLLAGILLVIALL